MATKVTQSTPQIKVKRELCSDEIKDFAETAMNELLGWYGYESNERMEITSKMRQSSAKNSKNIANISQKLLETKQNISNNNSSLVSNSNKVLHESSSVSSELDNSSRETSKSPPQLKINDKKENDCSWCHRTIPSQSSEILGTTEGTVFCSESCFSQSRRASFKRAKTCDWCRHIRHAVSYVDFHDGASQLQFCSDKCLNQYKMQIFCRETQAHLDMNPHLKDKSQEEDSLITPAMWLKNCRSRTPSPSSDHSGIPSPVISVKPATVTKPQSSPSALQSTPSIAQQSITLISPVSEPLKKPVISITPSSKLLSQSMLNQSSKLHHRNLRKRRVSARLSLTSSSSTNNSSSSINSKSLQSQTPLIPNHTELRAKMSVQMGQNSQNPPQRPMTFHQPHQFMVPPMRPHMYQFRPPQIPHSPRGPPQMTPLGHQQNFNPMMNGINNLSSLNNLNNGPPPITILVPYPIIVPVPIPIPTMDFLRALHGMSKNKSANLPPAETKTESLPTPENLEECVEEVDEPLDYTKQKSPDHPGSSATDLNCGSDESNSISLNKTNNLTSISGNNVEQKLPKFKITRLNSKRMLTKELSVVDSFESSRPLRKRKRIIVESDATEDND